MVIQVDWKYTPQLLSYSFTQLQLERTLKGADWINLIRRRPHLHREMLRVYEATPDADGLPTLKLLAKADLLSYEAYERSRDSFRQRIIELKQRRRLSIGDKVTLVFENRHTVQFQIQEMIRAERIFDPDKVQGELDVYNALLPSDGELSATLFVEITDRDAIERDLDAFQGINHGRTVAICAGPSAVYGQFEGGHSKKDKLSAVHCVKFCPSPEWIREVAQEGASVSIRIEHSAYRREVTVSDEMRQEWLADLRL